MSLGFVVVAAAIGFFVLAPLVLAWVSADPARWGRVEAVLGREPRGSERAARWAPRFWLVAGAGYLVLGIVQARTEERDGPPWLSLLLGGSYLLNGGLQYRMYRRMRRRAASAEPQVEDRAEPGGPAPGG
jgi:heme A synthase